MSARLKKVDKYIYYSAKRLRLSANLHGEVELVVFPFHLFGFLQRGWTQSRGTEHRLTGTDPVRYLYIQTHGQDTHTYT